MQRKLLYFIGWLEKIMMCNSTQGGNMNKFKEVAIIIPAYKPDERLKILVDKLIEENFENIIVVNDGSGDTGKNVFDYLENLKECIVLNHAVNLGKGRGLKTAFNYFLNHFNNNVGVITVDADGQHLVQDIKKIANKLLENPTHLILGARNFSIKNIPFRSRFGNIITKFVFNFATGIKITDTQTGLRGIPTYFVKNLLTVSGERYEFEMNMLLECKEQGIPIKEVGIETVYINDNESSHFNPLLDSIRIYSLFFKYIFSSLSSFAIDILLYSLFIFLLKGASPENYIVAATIMARVISSLYNYLFNKNIVFKSNNRHTLLKYYFLSIFQMLISAFLVQSIFKFVGEGEVVIKILVDTFLFVLSFVVQREWVFKSDQHVY